MSDNTTSNNELGADDLASFLGDSVLVVGDDGLHSARSLAKLGYDVRLAQLADDESLVFVWQSNEGEVTIDLEDHGVRHTDLVYVAEPVEKFVRIVKVARRMGAAVVWSPFPDYDGQSRRIVEGAGLVFVAGTDIVVLARRHRRQQALQRLEMVEAQQLAYQRWAELGEAVAIVEHRAGATAAVRETLGVSERAANYVLTLSLSRRTKQTVEALEEERAVLLERLNE